MHKNINKIHEQWQNKGWLKNPI